MSLLNPAPLKPPLYRPDGLLDTLADYIQTKSGAAQLRQQNLEEEKRRQEEYQRRVEADVVGVEPYSLFFGRATEDPSVGFQLTPADLWPGSAAVKAGLLGAAAIPAGIWARHAWKSAPTPGTLGAFGYHGTPHQWAPEPSYPLGRPDLSKVGTGEGAQVYGHGIYFSEEPEVAGMYAQLLKPTDELFDLRLGGVQIYRRGTPVDYGPRSNDPAEHALAILQEDALIREWDLKQAHQMGGEKGLINTFKDMLYDRIDYAKEEAPEYLPFFNEVRKKLARHIGTKINIKKGESSFYKTDIPDSDIAKMLDWDAPLKVQGQHVDRLAHKYGVANTADGGTLVEVMGRKLGQKRASKVLNSSGIPGIKYLDQQSRQFLKVTPKTHEIGKLAGQPSWGFFDKKSGYMDTDLPLFTKESEARAWLEGKRTRNFVISDEDLLDRIKILERH